MTYRIADFGPSDLLTSNIEGSRRVKVDLNPRSRDPFDQLITAEYTPLIERKPLPGLSLLRDRVEPAGGNVTVANGELVINGTAAKTALYTRGRGRYLPGLYGIAGMGVRADWDVGSYEYGYGDDDGNRVGMEWSAGVPYTFVASFGTRYYRKPRSEWLDPLDGTGPSKLTADLSQHVFRMKIGWYGYLRVEFYIGTGDRENGDQVVLVDRAELPVGVSLEQPDLPIFAETDGGTLHVGGRQYGVYGRYRPEYRITTAFGAQESIGTTFEPLVSMRLKNTTQWQGVPVLLASISALSSADAEIGIIINGTLTDGTWGSVPGIDDTETALQANSTATAITGGYLAYGDNVPGGQGKSFGATSADMPDLDIPRDQTVTIAVRALSTTTDANVSMHLREEW